MIVSIHQPNFFPWLGYFDKIVRSDVFVFLDSVQFPKKGGTWLNRVQISHRGKPDWLTAPIDRSYHGFKNIHEMTFKDAAWKPKLLATLHAQYARAVHFHEVLPRLRAWILNEQQRIGEYNRAAILGLVDYLGLPAPRFEIASQLNVKERSTDLLIEIVKSVDGSTYLCGGGADGYQEDEKFSEAGLGLQFQDFQHPTYQQEKGSHFVPSLSILDALMHLGPDGTRELLTACPKGLAMELNAAV